MAIFGSLIALFAVFVDPMLQQSVVYFEAPQVNPLINGTIPIANNYLNNDFNGTSQLDEALMGAVYSSILSPDSSASDLNADCPTGNCTFSQTYQSLGICSACTNITPFMIPQWRFLNYSDNPGLNYSALSLEIEFPHEPFENGYTPRFSHRATSCGAAMNFTSQEAPNYLFNLSEYNIPFSAGSRVLPNVSINAASDPFLAVWSISVTGDQACTSDWMDGGPTTDSDCLDSSKVPTRLNLSVPTIYPFENQSLERGGMILPDGKIRTLSEMAKVPVLAWPKLSANLCTLSFCGQTYRSEVRSSHINETKLGDQSMLMLRSADLPQQLGGASLDGSQNWILASSAVYVPETCVINGSEHSITEYVDIPQVMANDSMKIGAYSGYVYNKKLEKRMGPPEHARNWSETLETSPNRSLLEQCNYPISRQLGMVQALGVSHCIHEASIRRFRLPLSGVVVIWAIR